MTQFKLHTLETAPEGAKEILNEAQKQNGFIPNLDKIAHTPLDEQIEEFKWEPSSKKNHRMKSKLIIFLTLLISINTFKVMAQSEKQENSSDKLVVVWTSDDPYLAERMVLMYAYAAKNNDWFNEVTLIIWGPSAKMVSENLKIQKKLKAMQKDGVEIKACIACASAYDVVEDLKKLDFEVKGMGKPLTDYLKSDAKVLTF